MATPTWPSGLPRACAHHDALRAWHEEHGEGRLRGDREFEDFLENTYATAADHNQRINEYRSDQLFLGRRWMIFAAVVIGFSGLTFVVNQQLREKPPEQFVIVDQRLPTRSESPMSQ
ncbi:MAG TPA: hypothetical protein VFS20_04325, partial [Longimicrobium sp.]|nr:hypothetical protein [Longimicrobium sp.]